MKCSPGRGRPLLIWIDIENLPQVQYLLPFGAAFRRVGAEVVFTARDDGFTVELLRKKHVPFRQVGASSGASKWQKARGVWQRSSALVTQFRNGAVPDALLSPSRSAALAARRLGIPSFAFSDYEHGDLTVYRLAATNVFYPDVLDPAVLVRRGLKPGKLLAYSGLKEDVAFAGIDLGAVRPHVFPPSANGAVKVLFRPPAEQSHYFRRASGDLALAALADLARRDDVLVVYSPRTPGQVAYVDHLEWRREPIVLREPIGFVSLLKAVDAVVSGGGTMLREAAYLGVPAYSIFQGEISAVDRYLESIGRLSIVGSASEFGRVWFEPGLRRPVLESNTRLVDEVTDTILERLEIPARVTGTA